MSPPTPNLYPLRRLKVAATIRPSGVDKHTLDGESSVELCNYVDVYKNERISRRIGFMKASATAAEIERFSLCPGDVIITKDSETSDDIASAALVEESAAGVICAYHLAIIRPDPNVITGNFLFWSLRCAEVLSQFSVRAQGVTRFGLTTGGMGEVLLPVPPASLQPVISAFLDRETAKIDTLVAEQERLIGLLKEKRQAVISQTVTKGLDPNVPVRDSGVEWLGQVPSGWQVLPIRFLFRFVKRQNGDALDVLSVYRDYGVIKKDSRSGNINKTPEDLSSYQTVIPGDLVINKMKSWQGSLGISYTEGITSPDYAVFASIHDGCPEYLNWLLRCNLLPDVYRSLSNGIRPDQWRLEPEKFKNLRIPCPPKIEQEEIAQRLRSMAATYDALADEAECAISLLKERRSVLISAAVTGKIDVRGLAPAIQEAA